ncbi:MAG: metal ABC transporter solute-binding protein, Zn/Mn family [Heyndrickxia sp.]
MKKPLLLIIFTLFLIMATACSNQGEKTDNNQKLNVYTTVYPLEYFTKQIGGKYVSVKTIYPPGSDEHTYEPSQKDMMDLADSDLFLYIGLGLEGFASKAKDILKAQNVDMVATGEQLKLPHDASFNDGDEHGDVNPHVWLDPIYMKEMTYTISKELAKKMPEHKKEFEKNYTNVAKKLDELNQQFIDVTKQSKEKEIVVTHAAYTYWELRYGIKQDAIAGVSTSDEPSQKKLKGIIDTIKKDHLSYILFEQNVQSKLAEVVQQETGTKVLYLNNLAVLRETDIKNNEDYFSIMQKNIHTLKTALN